MFLQDRSQSMNTRIQKNLIFISQSKGSGGPDPSIIWALPLVMEIIRSQKRFREFGSPHSLTHNYNMLNPVSQKRWIHVVSNSGQQKDLIFESRQRSLNLCNSYLALVLDRVQINLQHHRLFSRHHWPLRQGSNDFKKPHFQNSTCRPGFLTIFSLWRPVWTLATSQHGHDESNKIVEDMEKTIAASLFDTYRVRNHLALNPTNSKLIRLKKQENKNIWIFHLYTDLISLF